MIDKSLALRTILKGTDETKAGIVEKNGLQKALQAVNCQPFKLFCSLLNLPRQAEFSKIPEVHAPVIIDIASGNIHSADR